MRRRTSPCRSSRIESESRWPFGRAAFPAQPTARCSIEALVVHADARASSCTDTTASRIRTCSVPTPTRVRPHADRSRLGQRCARVWSRAAIGDEHGPMPFDVDRLLRLWTDPLPEDDGAAAAAFRELYSDPVTVNGIPLTGADLVARARVMQEALERPEREVLSVVDAGASVAVAFRLAGRQVGPLETPAGRIPPTGQRVDVRIIDVLTLTDGRISGIVMVADWLTALAAAGAVHVSVPGDDAVPSAGPHGRG
jgi:hypothetical protein